MNNHRKKEAQIHREEERSLTARTRTVWAGFTLLLLLIIGSSAYSYISVVHLDAAYSQVRIDSRDRDDLLDMLAHDIYRAGTLARDHLLESDERLADVDRAGLEEIRTRMYQGLASYEAKSPAKQASSLAAFHGNIDRFWEFVEPPLHWSPEQRERDADAYLAEVLLPKGQEVELLAREIAVRDKDEVQSLDLALENDFAKLQGEMIGAFGLVMVSGLAAALLSVRRIRRLEGEAEARYQQVERARLELRELSSQVVNAQEEERRNLSRELHDQLGQTMSALVAELGRLEHDTGSSDSVKEALAAARQIAEDNVRSIRDTALLLRPSMLDDLGLVPALKWQAREVRRRDGLKVRVAAEEASEELPDAYNTCIYRVVQEALHNCVKHAAASEARVVLRQTPEGLSVSIQDDGAGFDTKGERGMGLLGMEERVTRLGGLFRIESQPGHGTVLSMLFPGLIPGAGAAAREAVAEGKA